MIESEFSERIETPTSNEKNDALNKKKKKAKRENMNKTKIANENIQKVVKGIDGKEINIINCYDITKYKDITEILDKHDFVLNTSGIKNIEEVFVDYKNKANYNDKSKIKI